MLNPDARKLAQNLPDPDEVDPPKLRRAVEQFAAMVREHNDAMTAAHTAENELNQAKVADRDAYAAAIRAGKADPGTPTTKKAEDVVAAARRRVEAVTLAADQAHNELLAAMTDHGPTWVAQLYQRRAEQATWLTKTIEEPAAAAASLARTAALIQFAGRGKLASSLRVPGLERPNGQAPTVEEVLGALRALADEQTAAEPEPAAA